MVKRINKGGDQFTPRESWNEIAQAIENAAEEARKPPTRQAVEKALLILNPNACRGDALVGNLGRMGFGWLGGKTGRPRKPKIPKPTNEKKLGRKRGE